MITGPVLLGGDDGRLTGPVADVLTTLGAEVWAPETGPTDLTFKALVFDATGIDVEPTSSTRRSPSLHP